MAKQKDTLTLLKEELEKLLNKPNKTRADVTRTKDLVREIQLQEQALITSSKTLETGKLLFGDAYGDAFKKSSSKEPKKVIPTFKGSTSAEKLSRSDFRSIGWRERNFPTGIPGLPIEGNEAAMKRAKETKAKIKKELDLAKSTELISTSDRLGIDLPSSLQDEIKTVARGLVESNPAGIDPAKREQFIQDVADEMAAQVEEAARSDTGKMNIMDFSEGNPMIIESRQGTVKDLTEAVDPKSKAAKAYAKEFGIETKSATDSGFNISIRTLEGQLDMITDTIENTKGEISGLGIARTDVRDKAIKEDVKKLNKQKNIISNLLQEQIETLNKETASIYVKNLPSEETRVKKTWRGDIVKGADGKPILETKPIGDTKEWKSSGKDRVDKIIKDLNITGDRIIDVDDFDIMYKSKYEKKIQKDSPVTKEQLIMTESERLISSWQKQISPGAFEANEVDPDAAKYQTVKEAEGSIKFKKSQSPMTNLLKNALQDAGTLPGEAGMISERMEYMEGVNEPRGREWWSEGLITEKANPSVTKGETDIGSFRGIGGDPDATGFQIKGVAGQQIDKELEGKFIRNALSNPVVLETNVVFGYKPEPWLSGTLQADKEGNIKAYKPVKDQQTGRILNQPLKNKDFIDDKGNLTKAGKKYRINVPAKPDPKNYLAKDDYKKAERIYKSNLNLPAKATVYAKDLPGHEGPEIELKAEVTKGNAAITDSKDVDVTITGKIKDTSFTTQLEVPAEPEVHRRKAGKGKIKTNQPRIRTEGPPQMAEIGSLETRFEETVNTANKNIWKYPSAPAHPTKRAVDVETGLKEIPQTKTVTKEIKGEAVKYGSSYSYGLKDIAARGIEIPGKVRVTDYGIGAQATFEVSDKDFRKHLETLGRVKDTKYGKSEVAGLAKGLKKGEAATFGGLKGFNVGSQDVFNILYGEAREVRNIKVGIGEELISASKEQYAAEIKANPDAVVPKRPYGSVTKSAVETFAIEKGLMVTNKKGKEVLPSNIKGRTAKDIVDSLEPSQLQQIAPEGQKYLFQSEAKRAPKKTFQYKATGVLSEKNKFTHLFKQEDYTTLRKSYEKDLAWKAYTESVKNKKGVKKYSSSTDTGTLLKASDPAVVNKYLSQASSAMSGQNISQNFYNKDGSFNSGALSKLAQQRIYNDAQSYADKSLKPEDSKKFLTELKKGIKMVIGKG